MATRKTAPRASAHKATVTDVPFVETITPEAAPQPSAYEQYKASMHKMLDEALATPTHGWKRTLMAWLLSLAVATGIGWLMGYVITAAVVGAALLSSSVFVSSIIMVLGIIASMYIGYKTSPLVYAAVIDRTIERAAVGAWRKTKSFFTPGSKVAA